MSPYSPFIDLKQGLGEGTFPVGQPPGEGRAADTGESVSFQTFGNMGGGCGMIIFGARVIDAGPLKEAPSPPQIQIQVIPGGSRKHAFFRLVVPRKGWRPSGNDLQLAGLPERGGAPGEKCIKALLRRAFRTRF